MIITERLRLTQLIKGWKARRIVVSRIKITERENAGRFDWLIFRKDLSGMLQFFLEFKRVDFTRIEFIDVVSRETCRILVGGRFFWKLSVCTIIALFHPSRCLREKHEKGCENWDLLLRHDLSARFIVRHFVIFFFFHSI